MNTVEDGIGNTVEESLSILSLIQMYLCLSTSAHTHTHTQPFYGSVEFVRDNPGEPVSEETFTHSHSSWSSIISICFLHLLRSMASSLFNPRAMQSFLHNLSPSFLWPGTLHFILHTFLHPIIVIFSQHMTIPSQPVLL